MKKFTICAQFVMRFLKPNFALPCGRMICTNCVKKNTVQLYWYWTSTNIKIDLDDFDWFFHAIQWLNLLGAPAQFFPSCFTWLVFVISWHFCVQSVWFWPFSLFFSRSKMSFYGTGETLDLILLGYYFIRSYLLQANATAEDPKNEKSTSCDSTNSQPNFKEVQRSL